jgi:hypothetical protein
MLYFATTYIVIKSFSLIKVVFEILDEVPRSVLRIFKIVTKDDGLLTFFVSEDELNSVIRTF